MKVSSLAPASLVLNVALAFACAWTWQRPRVAQPQTGELPAEVAASTAAPATPAPPAFRWQQLEAPDFPTYAQNLRDIGCPEATIHDIIQAELREIYDARREELRKELASSPAAAEVLEQRLQEMSLEETASFAVATGPATAAPEFAPMSAPASGTSATLGVTAEPAAEPAVAAAASFEVLAEEPPAPAPVVSSTLTPTAFTAGEDPARPAPTGELSLIPSDARLDAPTATALTSIRQTFANTMAAAGTDASSPLYRESWTVAQRHSDESFSSLFGGDAYVRSQIQAAQKQYQQSLQQQQTQSK